MTALDFLFLAGMIVSGIAFVATVIVFVLAQLYEADDRDNPQ